MTDMVIFWKKLLEFLQGDEGIIFNCVYLLVCLFTGRCRCDHYTITPLTIGQSQVTWGLLPQPHTGTPLDMFRLVQLGPHQIRDSPQYV